MGAILKTPLSRPSHFDMTVIIFKHMAKEGGEALDKPLFDVIAIFFGLNITYVRLVCAERIH